MSDESGKVTTYEIGNPFKKKIWGKKDHYIVVLMDFFPFWFDNSFIMLKRVLFQIKTVLLNFVNERILKWAYISMISGSRDTEN